MTTFSDAALMADEFVLIQVSASYLSKSKLSVSERNKKMVVHQNTVAKSSADNASFTHTKGEMVCFYCRKPGRKIADCAVLRRKDKAVKPVGLFSTSSVNFIPDKQTEQMDITEMDKVKNSVDFGPFLTDGSVSLPDCDAAVPVRILRDIGAGQSFLLEEPLPLSKCTATGSHVLVSGLEMGYVEVPLHCIHLNSKLVSGDVVVGVRAMLPIPGVKFIFGNDLAGGNVWDKSDGDAPPIVVSDVEKQVDGSSDCPNLFPACAITRAMDKRGMSDEMENVLSDTLISSINSQSEPDTVYNMAKDGIPVREVPFVVDQTDKSASMSERSFICDDHVNICSLSSLYSVTQD